MEKSVFISYKSEEKDVADLVKSTLESNGFSCWIAPECIPYGGKYSSEIPTAIKESKVFVLILSSNSMQSNWVEKELDSAINKKKVIIPFRIDDADFSDSFDFYLNNVQRIEAYKRIKLALNELVERVKNIVYPNGQKELKIYLDTIIHNPSCHIIGRENEISKIEEAFKNDNIVCLSGVGGIGKSELSREFAKRNYKKKYDNIQFVDYRNNLVTTISTLAFANFNEKAFIENYSDENTPLNKALYKKKLELLSECNNKNLIVIDGFDNVDDENASDLLALNCHILITSRGYFETFDNYLDISSFENINDLIKLFANYCDDVDFFDEEQLAMVKKIIELVGSHTLTVKLIAQLMETNGYPLQMMYDALLNNDNEVLDDKIKHGNVYTTLNGHLDRLFVLSNFDEEDKLIMSNLSLIPSSGILKYQFKKWSDKEDTMSRVSRLVDFGWIISSHGKISLHPLIASMVHKRLNINTIDSKVFIKNLCEYAIYDKLETNTSVEETKELLNYAYKYLTGNDQLMVEFLIRVSRFNTTYTYRNLFSINDKKEAGNDIRQMVDNQNTQQEGFRRGYNIMLKALDLQLKQKELNPKLYFEILSCLAADLFNLKDYEGAIKGNLKCLEFLKSVKPEHSHEELLVVRRLGIDYIYNKTYEEAKKAFYESLEIIDNLTFDNNVVDFEKSRVYTHLGDIATYQNNDKEALSLYQKAYDLIKDFNEYLLSQGVLCLKIADLKAKVNFDVETLKYYQLALDAFKAKSTDEVTINYIENILNNAKVSV